MKIEAVRINKDCNVVVAGVGFSVVVLAWAFEDNEVKLVADSVLLVKIASNSFILLSPC